MTATAATLQADVLRPMQRQDNPAVASVIRDVLTEFGCTGPGYAIHDPEVDYMYETYQKPRCRYFVIEDEGRVAGGGGIAPLKGGDNDTCELQKYYLRAECRGRGDGWKLLEACLGFAKEQGYSRCYLETTEQMNTAKALYVKAGFRVIDKAMGNTGHPACNRWYVKEL